MQSNKVADRERAVAADPSDPDLRHLLAAEYAQVGEYRRAEHEFREVLALKPAAHIARFQLGLLDLTLGEPHRR